MKKITSLFIMCALLICSAISTFAEERHQIIVKDDIGKLKIIYNSELQFSTSPFVDENGRTMVPLRELCDYLGYDVIWHESALAVSIFEKENPTVNNHGGKGGDTVVFYVDKPMYRINSRTYEMDTKAVILNGRTFVPIRVLCESLGYEVIWQE